MEASIEFLRPVREYIALIEDCARLKPYEVLYHCNYLLPAIYTQAANLPNVEPDPTYDLPRIEGRTVFSKLKDLFGKYDPYQHFFLPFYDREPVVGSLSDDLGDIYLDLKRGLLAYEQGRREDAIWDWWFGLRSHYGQHIVFAMPAIHFLVFQSMEDDYENVSPRNKEESIKARVLNVGAKEIELEVGDEHFSLSYKRFPQFEEALLGAILNVISPRPGYLNWPDLDVELEVESFRNS